MLMKLVVLLDGPHAIDLDGASKIETCLGQEMISHPRLHLTVGSPATAGAEQQ
jgi:hypothetical protein